jgi:hypothetical protein
MQRLLLVVLILICPSFAVAENQVAVFGGILRPHKTGELSNAPIVIGEVAFGKELRLYSSFSYAWSKKIESYTGYVINGSSELVCFVDDHSFVDVGLSYTYRNGGPWVKQVGFFKFGIGREFVTKDVNPFGDTIQIKIDLYKEVLSINSLNNVVAAKLTLRDDIKMTKNGSAFLRIQADYMTLWYDQPNSYNVVLRYNGSRLSIMAGIGASF